ncbi:hypothetical protein [Sediminicola luteus]|uniref:Uncharacterized protein n=1 Tax=Sediminicola luteus TaxID=319238 RepID=A0A2A4G6F1_9FLAO|nr:hypothetical protein [Sediminicola luteus]PCE64227.1 hypothetical protein B7P33_07955 [Sediminicola luteus]
MTSLIITALGLWVSFSQPKYLEHSASPKTEYQQPNYKKYPFKSARVSYTFSGDASGASTLFIDDFGYKESHVENSTTTFMGVATPKNESRIMVGSEQTEIDHNSGTATQSINPLHAYYAVRPNNDYIALGEQALTQMGFTKVGQEMVLGKNCDVWQGPVHLWTWKGLTLKTVTKMMGMTLIEEATQLELDVPIDPKHFQVPNDIQITGGNLMLEELGKTMDIVLDPETRNSLFKIKDLNFEQWKKQALKDDPFLKEYNEEELREEFRLLKEMAQGIK